VILRPPGVAEQMLARALRASPYRDDILGDLHESYAAAVAAHSTLYARCWYWAHAIRLAVRSILRRAHPVSSVQPAKGHRMDRLLMDLRFALRPLLKQPTTTIAIIVTLALGVGANVAVFGVIDALLLRPFTMRNVDRIVMPVSTSPHWSGRRETVSAADFLDWRTSLRGGAIDHLAGMNWWDANLVGRDQPERVLGFFVSPEFFAALNAQPAIGRTFLPEEEIAANATRVILSDGLWKRRFGADPAIVGKSTLIDGAQWLVVGVMPPAFDFPMRAELWGVLSLDEKSARNRSDHYLTVIGKLGDGRTLDEARSEVRALSQRLAREHPETNSELAAEVYTVSRGMADVGVPAVLALWQAAGLRTPLVSGRAFTDKDRKGGEAVAIVSEAMARKFWPSGGALDQQVRIANGPWMRVVGVAGDIVHDWFDVGTTGSRVPTLYRPIAQAPSDTFALAIRTAGDPLSLVADARTALAQVDATQPIFDVMTLRQVLNEKTISLRYIATVMGAFAGLAVMLAVLGLYAVMTFLVARRVREIGVRIALGATAHDVVRLTLGQAARLTAIGIAVGFVMAVALGRLMEAGLLGIVSSDIRVSAALAAGLGATALFSSYLPARRAASVDPSVALRAE
jgi:hypothetical protein